jgi:hypothetical protein
MRQSSGTGYPENVEALAAELAALAVGSILELQRQHPHADHATTPASRSRAISASP